MPESKHKAWSMLCLALLTALLCLLPGGAEARSAVQKLNYFQTYETEVDGKPAVRIEIGMQPGKAEYTVREEGQELVLDMPNTRRGKLREDITIKNDIVSKVNITEPSRRHTIIKIKSDEKLSIGENKGYRITEVQADRRKEIPWRLAIEVFRPDEPKKADAVDGLSGHTIVIDPGHGGSDSGCTGYNGTLEKDVTLEVSQRLRTILENSGAHVVMTRDDDRDVYGPNASDAAELQSRIDVGLNTPGAEAFLCIHCNAFDNPAAHGVETYYYAPSEESRRFASLLDDELVQVTGFADRGVKTARFYVLRHAGSLPASLVELGFLTNPHEEDRLTDPALQQRIAKALATALARFLG